MTGNPTFLEKELVPERGVVLEEYNRSVDSPSGHAFSELQNHFFSSGFSHQILGTRKQFRTFPETKFQNLETSITPMRMLFSSLREMTKS